MLFEDVEINRSMQEELDAFFTPSEHGQRADFIIRQPENPDPDAIRIPQKDLMDTEALEVLQETMRNIWGP